MSLNNQVPESRPPPQRVSRQAFISHHHEDVTIANEVAASLGTFGLAGFIAHRDLQEGGLWIEEIKRNLREAAVLLAVLTPKFIESDWTDQEVGFAVGRDVRILPIDAGATPYGFMRDVQALRWGNEATEGDRPGVGRMYWARDQIVNRLVRLGTALKLLGVLDSRDLVASLVGSSSWNATNAVLQMIGDLDAISEADGLRIAEASAVNADIYGCNQAIATLPQLFERLKGQINPELKARLEKHALILG